MSGPSATARRVAAYRLDFERLAAPFGDPAADDALGRDVAGETDGTGSEVMARYLRARTAFFDRVVVNAIERGVTQIVNLGAGYDGRSLRYAKPGVRWWEIDRADTQADKLARLGRLNLGAGQVTFVPRDLAEGGLAEALRAAGYEPEAAGLFVCEGVAAYLDDSVLERLLRDTRALATAGTRLALSVGAAPASDAHAERRERIRAAAARLGEPAVGSVTARDAAALLAASRWRPAEISERARQAGFVVAVPLWAPASDAQPRTTSMVGRFIEEMLRRAGTDTLGGHLETTYGVPITGTRELDLGVHAVERSDGSRWMARVFPAARTTAAVRADAAALGWLAAAGFPAERCADPEPVSIHEGQPVLVTEFLPGCKPPPPAGADLLDARHRPGYVGTGRGVVGRHDEAHHARRAASPRRLRSLMTGCHGGWRREIAARSGSRSGGGAPPVAGAVLSGARVDVGHLVHLQLHERLRGGDAADGGDPFVEQFPQVIVVTADQLGVHVRAAGAGRDVGDLVPGRQRVDHRLLSAGKHAEQAECQHAVAQAERVGDGNEGQRTGAHQPVHPEPDGAFGHAELPRDLPVGQPSVGLQQANDGAVGVVQRPLVAHPDRGRPLAARPRRGRGLAGSGWAAFRAGAHSCSSAGRPAARKPPST
jgi:methyltransferase (TIGR00027 family)